MFKWFLSIFSLGAPEISAYLYDSWCQELSIQVHSIQIYTSVMRKTQWVRSLYACTPETDDCR